MKNFTTKAAFNPNLFVDIRKRLSTNKFCKLNKLIIENADRLKPRHTCIKVKNSGTHKNDDESSQGDSPNKGTLKADATIVDQEIKFLTDINLLNIGRENLERMIDLLYDAKLDKNKPRDYRRKARQEYLNISKKRRKSKKVVRKGIKAQLQFVTRDLRIIKDLMKQREERARKLSRGDKAILETITKVYEQQKWMFDNH